jgi:hypothetical protein
MPIAVKGGNRENRGRLRVRVQRLTTQAVAAYMTSHRPDGRVVMQRTANPRTAVRFRFRPPGL